MTLIPGQVLNNRYRIVKLLGQGGFGAVYKAWDVNLNGAVAVKENYDTSPASQSQFAREASILFNLRHPNLPRVSDHFSLPGQGQYLVMDYIEGEDLEELRQKGAGILPERQVLAWMLQVLDALVYLHNRQPPVIHRDLKPANIKILPDGSAMLVDFGIAKIYDPKLKTTLGARAVTPGYSPPEQYGLGTTDARSDLYALGAVMYTLLTGQEPPESVQRSIGTALVSPRALSPALSTETENVILRAMELQPDRRYQCAAEFRQALLSPPSIQPALSQVSQPALGLPTYQSPPIVSTYPVARTTPPLVSRVISPRKGVKTWHIGLVIFIVVGSLVVYQLTRVPGLLAGGTEATPKDEMVQVYVPAGEFLMGSLDSDTILTEISRPQHKVYLDAFWIDSTEVTNAMYTSCVKDKVCRAHKIVKSNTRSHYYDDSQFDSYPVIYVSWDDANSYCQWIGGRLPTDAEWEKAARGGLESKFYPWGDEDPICDSQTRNGANFGYCRPADTTPVGNFLPNGYGLYDMAGNVLEWVVDWYDEKYYSSFPADAWPANPSGPRTGNERVLRGGYWGYAEYSVRVALRWKDSPDTRNSGAGFRCAR